MNIRAFFHRILPVAVAVVVICIVQPAGAVEVQRVKAAGAEAWLVEDHSVPVISVTVAFRGGAALDPDGKVGLAELAASLLDEGAGDLDSETYQAKLADIAADVNFDAGLDTVAGSLRTLSTHADEAFTLFGLALTSPRFDPEPVARVKDQMLSVLKQEAEDPNVVASRRARAAWFPDHPYGRPVNGTPESLAAISVDDLKAFAKNRLARDVLVVGVAGDITPEQLAKYMERMFAPLPEKAALGNVADIVPHTEAGVTVVDMPARQSAIVFGQPGLKRDDPDFYALTVINQAFGGSGLTSRLFDQVREKRGLVYSIYTTPEPMERSALVVGRAGTVNERAGETVDVVRQEWQRLAENGLTPSELADTKTFLTGSFPLRLTSSGRIAWILTQMQLDNLGIDYLEKRNSYIEKVTVEDARRVSHRVFDVKKLNFVVAGKPAGINQGSQ